MDPVGLAHDVALALTPFLPVLTTAADEVKEALGRELGEAGVSWAQCLWARLMASRSPGSSTAELEAAAQQAAAAREDPDALAAFRWQVRRRLAGDGELQEEVEELLAEAPPTIAVGDRSVAIGGTTTGTTIVTGDHNTLR
jgi:hypothetical protein